MLVGDLLQCGEQLLKQGPPAPAIDHALVFLQRGGGELGPLRLRSAQIFLREETAEQGAVGQQRHCVITAERRHVDLGPAIDEGVLHLVRDDADPVIGDHTQALGVEIGQREMANFAFLLQGGEMLERV